MPRGGARANAGRKSNGEIQRARELLDLAITEDDWLSIFKGLGKAAKGSDAQKGDARAGLLLMSYRFGVPTQYIAQDPDAKPIQFVEVVRSGKRAGRSTRRSPKTPLPRGTAEGVGQ